MKEKRRNKKYQTGITLVALVVTIVVLIILATISINIILGDDGIFNEAKTAKEKYLQGSQKEANSIDKAGTDIDELITGTRTVDFKDLQLDYENKIDITSSLNKANGSYTAEESGFVYCYTRANTNGKVINLSVNDIPVYVHWDVQSASSYLTGNFYITKGETINTIWYTAPKSIQIYLVPIK